METLVYAPAPKVGEGRLIAIEGKAPPEKATVFGRNPGASAAPRVGVAMGFGAFSTRSRAICFESFRRLSRDAIRAVDARVVTLLSVKKQLMRHSLPQ